MKLQNNWPEVGFVDVISGPRAAEKIGATYGDDTIVAIFEVSPNIPFYVGFKSSESMLVSSNKIELADGRFGMKLGDDEVSFFVIPFDMQTSIKLMLIEYSVASNPLYDDLIVY